MKDLILEKTANTPAVSFKNEGGILKIEGRSIPENPGDFYDRLINWLKEYYNAPASFTKMELNLEYVNSGSSKYLLGIFRLIKKKHDEGYKSEVNWFYEEDDEAIRSLGEHYRSTVKLPFNLIEYI